MKKFIIKITVFILLFKVFDLLLSSFFVHARLLDLSLEADYGSLNRMYHGLINSDIIAFGSSRTYLHINPEVLQKKVGKTVWNLGVDGSNFEQQIFTLEEYLLHNTHPPQVVIFEADLMSLDTSLLRFKTELFRPYQGYSKHTSDLFITDWESQLNFWIISSSIYKQEIPGLINSSVEIFDRIIEGSFFRENFPITESNTNLDVGDYFLINGAQIKNGQVPNQLPQTLPYSEPQRHFDLSNKFKREVSFEKLSEFAEERGFILILLMSPYLAGEVDENQRKLAVDFYSSLSDKYANTYFMDFSSSNLFAYDTSIWWNIGHLNIDGANLLSDKLGEELNWILQSH